eukprot:PhF_6_TR38755/c0_g1_i2/m.58027
MPASSSLDAYTMTVGAAIFITLVVLSAYRCGILPFCVAVKQGCAEPRLLPPPTYGQQKTHGLTKAEREHTATAYVGDFSASVGPSANPLLGITDSYSFSSGGGDAMSPTNSNARNNNMGMRLMTQFGNRVQSDVLPNLYMPKVKLDDFKSLANATEMTRKMKQVGSGLVPALVPGMGAPLDIAKAQKGGGVVGHQHLARHAPPPSHLAQLDELEHHRFARNPMMKQQFDSPEAFY